MIIVTGATGHFGRLVVDHLLGRLGADGLGVSVREPSRADDLAARGVRVRRGDFTAPGTLADAFEGATQVLVVSVDVLGPEGVAQSTAAVDAAYAAGAERVLYTSHQAAAADSLFAPARDHAAVEAHLERGGRPHTALRNGYYSSSLAFHLGDAAATGELRLPADGPVSWTAREDLAQAAAAILAGEASFDGPTPPLTAAEAVDMGQVAAMVSEGAGRAVQRITVDDEDFVAARISHGMPEHYARAFLGTYLAARGGEFARVDPALGTLLGREPQPVADALRAGATAMG